MQVGKEFIKAVRAKARAGGDRSLLKPYVREDGACHIEVDLREEDPFLSYSGKRSLDNEIFEYVDAYKKAMPNPYPVAMDFLVRPGSDEKSIERAFHNHYELELSEHKRAYYRTRILSVAMLIFGALLMALYLIFTFGNLGFVWEVIAEVISIASWVFIWAAVEKWCFDASDLRRQCRYDALMCISSVSFKSAEAEK